MAKIEFSDGVTVGGKNVTSIEVHGTTFMQFVAMWNRANLVPNVKTDVALQRERIKKQAVFTAGAEVVELNDVDLMQLPIRVTKAIIASLDIDEGTAGKIVISGDGATSPIVYKLGTPFVMKNAAGDVTVSELEFLAKTYGELEDVLVADSSLAKAAALVTRIAKPIEVPSLMQLPGWMIDRLTIADGFTIMKEVLPLF